VSINPSGWRPTTPANEPGNAETVTGNRALQLEEPLLFERGRLDQTGVDLPDAKVSGKRLSGLERNRDIGLPGLSEPEAVRHYTRLSRQNYAIDLGLFPLGSCTMKHNPRLNEKVARMPGFADVHPHPICAGGAGRRARSRARSGERARHKSGDRRVRRLSG
jgi:glycine dehydrogenase subunit 2